LPGNLFDIENRVVVVTGGLGQLGRQFSLSLLECGAKVAIFDLVVGEENSQQFRTAIHEHKLRLLSVDVTDKGPSRRD
jgi:NAD(P)-dependent dehydrogenase (short-subunit alcohol dehydrogenase family)